MSIASPKNSVALLSPRKVANSIPAGDEARAQRRRFRLAAESWPRRKAETPEPMVIRSTVVVGFKSQDGGCDEEQRNAHVTVAMIQNAVRTRSKMSELYCLALG